MGDAIISFNLYVENDEDEIMKNINLLLELKEKLNLTMLFISHDLNLVRYLSDTIAVMDKGTIVEKAPCGEIFENPKDEYTKFLLSQIRSINV